MQVLLKVTTKNPQYRAIDKCHYFSIIASDSASGSLIIPIPLLVRNSPLVHLQLLFHSLHLMAPYQLCWYCRDYSGKQKCSYILGNCDNMHYNWLTTSILLTMLNTLTDARDLVVRVPWIICFHNAFSCDRPLLRTLAFKALVIWDEESIWNLHDEFIVIWHLACR